MLGGNFQHQHYALRNIHPPLGVVWKKRVKSVVTDHPLALGDLIFAPTKSGDLYVVDYKTGESMGTGRLGPAMEHLPTIDRNILYAGMVLGNNTLVAFDLRKAVKKYSAAYPYVTTSPLIKDGKIYFGTHDKLFFCANIRDGSEIWKFTTHGPMRSSPGYAGGTIVFGDDEGWLYALDARSGYKIWEKRLEGSIFSHPVLDDSLIFVGTILGNMHCIDIHTGDVKWKKHFPGAIYGSPALFKNILYFGDNAHEVVALHKVSGDRIWTFKTEGVVNTVPLPSPDYLYVTSWDRYLYVLNRFTGQLIFKYPLKKAPKSSPIIYREYLLLHTANANLIAFANEKVVKIRRKH